MRLNFFLIIFPILVLFSCFSFHNSLKTDNLRINNHNYTIIVFSSTSTLGSKMAEKCKRNLFLFQGGFSQTLVNISKTIM